jgi:predicted Zn finger-like uncharacterized protein
MEIICPECQFSREVDETKIPARSQVATCPKCHTKFKFRDLPDEEFSIEEPEPAPPAEEEKPAPTGPRQASLLDPEPARPEKPAAPKEPKKTETTFPKLSAPGEDPGEELWDKLGGMTPPEKQEQSAPEPEPEPAPRFEPPADSRTDGEDQPEPVPGWTGEFNDDFPDPMEFEEEPEEEQGATMQVPPPFEQLDRYGFFHGLFLTIKLLLTSPRLFFSVMPVGGGLAKPLTFTILVTMIQSFAQYIWGMVGLSSSVSPEEASAGGMSATMTALVMLLLLPAFITVAQFLLTAIYHLLLMLMRAGSRGFEGTFRALVYSNAPIVLGIFPMPFKELELGWMFIVAVWGLVLTIMGLRYIHKTSYAKVIPVCLIPLLLGMIAALTLYQGQFTTI